MTMNRILAIVAIVILLVGAAVAFWWVRLPYPVTTGTLSLDGLDAPVTVQRDAWGTPHIYATTDRDAYFAQGVVHAQDRLWQMDVQRRVGHGRLSEMFGAASLEADRFSRVLGINHAAQRDWESLPSEAKAVLQVYSDGVNAYVATAPALPVEYQLLGVEWEPWEPVDSLVWLKVMQWEWSGNWTGDLLRAGLVERLGPTEAALLWGDSESLAVQDGGDIAVPDVGRLAETLHPFPLAESNQTSSIAWVLSGSHTASGMPLLVNDLASPTEIPGRWYMVGLHGADLDVIGASLPGIPAVVSGHNAHIAWGSSEAATGTNETFIEQLHEEEDRYLWQGRWLPLNTRQERVEVRGGNVGEVEVRETHRGSLVSDVVEGFSTPVALRWQAGGAPSRLFEALLALQGASNQEEFLEALGVWDLPVRHFVYADREGNIGAVVAGTASVLQEASAMAPSCGLKEQGEWGHAEPGGDELLQQWNPPAGYLVTTGSATTMLEGDEWQKGVSLVPQMRAARISEMLEASSTWTVEGVEAIQRDVQSAFARAFVPYFLRVESDDVIVQRAQEQLAAWNFELAGSLPGAAIYEVTYYFVVRELLFDELATDRRGEMLLEQCLNHPGKHVQLVQRLLREPEHPLWNDSRTPKRETRDEVLERSLVQMTDFLGRRFGDVPHEWFWDRLHTATFTHPLPVSEWLKPIFDRRLMGLGGDQSTVNALPFLHGKSFEVDSIPGYRQIISVGKWEESRWLQAPGQSGHPFHPHYDSMLERWQAVELVPMGWEIEPAGELGGGNLLRLTPP